MTSLAVLFLIGFNFCHWLGDYTELLTHRMLEAKKIGSPGPIFFHAYIHAVLMSFFCEIVFTYHIPGYNPFATHYTRVDTIFCLQLVSHFVIDMLKGKMNIWYPRAADPSNRIHWKISGADQYFHQLIIIIQVSLLTR